MDGYTAIFTTHDKETGLDLTVWVPNGEPLGRGPRISIGGEHVRDLSVPYDIDIAETARFTLSTWAEETRIASE